MALPPQAVEKLIHDPAETQGAYRQFVLLGVALFILMVVLYAGISFGYSAYLRRSSDDLNKKIQDFAARTSVEEQQKAANFYSQLVNLRDLLKSHTRVSPALELLDRTASADIYYTRMNMNAITNVVDLNGAARSIEAVARQAAILQKQPEVEKVNFTNAGQVQGLWQFTMSVFLKPDVLRTGGAPAQSGNALPSSSTSTASSTASSTATTTAP